MRCQCSCHISFIQDKKVKHLVYKSDSGTASLSIRWHEPEARQGQPTGFLLFRHMIQVDHCVVVDNIELCNTDTTITTLQIIRLRRFLHHLRSQKTIQSKLVFLTPSILVVFNSQSSVHLLLERLTMNNVLLGRFLL